MRVLEFQSIHSEHFLVHDEMDFNFESNKFVVISGPNGRGKTAIFDSLTWVLYDETTKRLKGDDVIRIRSGKNTFVELKFKIDNDQYVVKNYRKHHEFGDQKILMKNGVSIECIDRNDTNKKIEQLILPKEIFFNCLLFSQYMKKSFTQLTPGQQSDIFETMMNLKEYEQYYKKVTKKITAITNSIKNIDISISNNLSVINSIDDDIRVEKESYLEKLSEINEESSDLNSEINKIASELENFPEKDKLIENKSNLVNAKDDKNKQIMIIETDVVGIVSNFKNLKELTSDRFRNLLKDKSNTLNQELEQKNHIFEIELNQHNNLLSNLKKSKMNIETQLDNKKFEEKENKTSNLINELNSLREKRTEINSKIPMLMSEFAITKSSYKNKAVDFEEATKQLNEDVPICFACGQEVKDTKKLLQTKDKINQEGVELKNRGIQINNEIKSLTETRNKLDVEISDKESDINKIISNIEQEYSQKKTQELLKIDNEISKISEQINECNEKVSLLKQDADSKLSEIKSLLVKDHEEEQKKLLDKLNADKSKFEETLIKLKEEKSALEKELFEIEQIIVKREELLKALEIKNVRLENNTKTKDLLNNDFNTFIHTRESRKNEKVEENNTLYAEIDSLKRKQTILEFWKKAFSDQGIKGVLLDETIPLMNNTAKNLSDLIGFLKIRFDSQSTLKSGDQRNKFSVSVIETKNLANNRNNLSGGEGRLVDLITLMCLRSVLEKMYDLSINIYLFDEILDALDEVNVGIALNVVRKIAQEKCAVLITHSWKDTIECDEHLTL